MPSVTIEGAGLAGQVLHRELGNRGIASSLCDLTGFPRDKVCGGVMQWDSWQYLKSVFSIPHAVKTLPVMAHFWRGRQIARVALDPPMVYLSRWELDNTLYDQRSPATEEKGSLRVMAAGAARQKGEWLGFQTQCAPVPELQMHYGRGIYMGLTPTLGVVSHAALILKKDRFQGTDALKRYVKKELGVVLDGRFKGTKDIDYRVYAPGLAIGDAKLATHAFLGLGMKHAILSARLAARLIAENRSGFYPVCHRRFFRKYRWASRVAGRIYDSPFQCLLKPLFGHPALFMTLYHWLHAVPRELRE